MKILTSLGHKVDEILYFCQSLYRLQLGHSTLIQQSVNAGITLRRKGEKREWKISYTGFTMWFYSVLYTLFS